MQATRKAWMSVWGRVRAEVGVRILEVAQDPLGFVEEVVVVEVDLEGGW